MLWGNIGATIDQCDEMLRDVNELEKFAKAEDMLTKYQLLIEDCRLHFSAYAKYLDNRDRFENYAHYLADTHRIYGRTARHHPFFVP